MVRPARTAYRTAPLLAAASLALVLAGCGDTSPEQPTPTPTATATASPGAGVEDPDRTDPTGATGTPDPDAAVTLTPSPIDEDSTVTDRPTGPIRPDTALPTGPVPQGVAERAEVREAVAAEAERRGVDPDEVTVAGFAEVTWSDGSIGCPQDGMMYTQALVPGYQLVLEVGGSLASYHAAKDGPFSYCASPVPPVPGYGIETSDS